jgi:ABC-2 type transport system ATP-binding protein
VNATRASISGGSPDPIVRVDGLNKIYRPSPFWMKLLLRSAIQEPVVALDHVSFVVRAGAICAVVGPNGAGKSTLFRILTGLTTPTAGTATVCGLDCARQSAAVRRVVGFVPADDRSLYLRHTARENLYFHGNLQGMDRRDLWKRVDAALELVGLGHAKLRVGFALSAGMRARLQLARALLHEPTVLILDEPTGYVAPVGSYHLLRVIEEIAQERKLAVLISSHRLEEIEALHDHVLLLDRGHIVHEGDLNTLRKQWEKPRLHLHFATQPSADAAVARIHAMVGAELVSTEERDVVVATELPTGRFLDLLGGQLAEVDSIEKVRMSLGELLARVTAARPAPEPVRTADG